MRFFKCFILFSIICFWMPALNAGEIYMWKDEKGVLHMENKRPDKKPEKSDVMTFKNYNLEGKALTPPPSIIKNTLPENNPENKDQAKEIEKPYQPEGNLQKKN